LESEDVLALLEPPIPTRRKRARARDLQQSEHHEFPAPNGFRVTSIEVVPPQPDRPIRVISPDPIFRIVLVPETVIRRGWYQLIIRFPPCGTIDIAANLNFSDGKDFWRRLPALGRNNFGCYVHCSSELTSVVLIAGGSGRVLKPTNITFGRTFWLPVHARRLFHVVKRDGLAAIATIVQDMFGASGHWVLSIARGFAAIPQKKYGRWVRVFDEEPQRDKWRHVERMQTLRQHPIFSIITVWETDDEYTFDRFMSSLTEQIYAQWELIIAVPDAQRRAFAEKLTNLLMGHRVQVIACRVDAAATLNGLASKAVGGFLIRASCGTVLRQNALLELALTLKQYPNAALIYSDEDEIDCSGKRQNPSFKPAWSPEFFNVCDYLGELTALRRELVQQMGGWKGSVAKTADYDLKARVVDAIESDRIVHLAKVLIHIDAERPGGRAIQSRAVAERAIRGRCARSKMNAQVVWHDIYVQPRLKWSIPEPRPLISLLIPTRDRADMLGTCIDSILARTTYRPFEILIVDNDSCDSATRDLFDKFRGEPSIRILRRPGPFNFSDLNNAAAREAKGAILGLLNNDVEVKDGEWLTELVSLATRPEVGCVGCKLLYPDNRIQHAGVYLGQGNLAGHGHRFFAADATGYMNRLHLVQNVSAVTGACLFVRKAIFDQVGGLDEKGLAVVLNDVDFCLKVRAAGYLNLCTPFAELIHHESASRGRDCTPAKARRMLAEVNTFRRRWGAALIVDPYYSPHLSHDGEDFSVRVR
jgi:GT2 family glycosyltransferase